MQASTLGAAPGAAAAPAAQSYNEIWLEGSPDNHGHLLITDEQGRRTGYLDGKALAEIPGVTAVKGFSAAVWDQEDDLLVDRMHPNPVECVGSTRCRPGGRRSRTSARGFPASAAPLGSGESVRAPIGTRRCGAERVSRPFARIYAKGDPART